MSIDIASIMSRVSALETEDTTSYVFELEADAKDVLLTLTAPSESLAGKLEWAFKGYGYEEFDGYKGERVLAYGRSGEYRFRTVHTVKGVLVLMAEFDGQMESRNIDPKTGTPRMITKYRIIGFKRFDAALADRAIDWMQLCVGAHRFLDSSRSSAELDKAGIESSEFETFVEDVAREQELEDLRELMES